MKAFALIKMSNGSPDLTGFDLGRLSGEQITVKRGEPPVDTVVDEYIGGYAYIGKVGNWGAYLVYGTPTMLQELDALPGVVGIATKKQLDQNVKAAVRNKLNTWLTNHNKPTIPAGWTNRRLVKKIMKHFFPNYNLRSVDVGDDDVDEEKIVMEN